MRPYRGIASMHFQLVLSVLWTTMRDGGHKREKLVIKRYSVMNVGTLAAQGLGATVHSNKQEMAHI